VEDLSHILNIRFLNADGRDPSISHDPVFGLTSSLSFLFLPRLLVNFCKLEYNATMDIILDRLALWSVNSPLLFVIVRVLVPIYCIWFPITSYINTVCHEHAPCNGRLSMASRPPYCRADHHQALLPNRFNHRGHPGSRLANAIKPANQTPLLVLLMNQ
jgi:hypothetical protein